MKKKSIKYLDDFARKEHNGRCLSIEYNGILTKYKWQCKFGHIWEATGSNVLNNGSWCPQCAGNTPKSIEDAQKIAEERGGKCLSNKYINNYTKMKWECSEGHIWKTTFANIQYGKWCPTCAGNTPKSIKYLDDFAKKEHNGRCISTEYINMHTKYKWRCEYGHEWKAVGHNVVNSGTWCPQCNGNIKLEEDYVRKEIEKEGYQLLSKFKNTTTKIKLKCTKGHIYKVFWRNFQQGKRCPKCNNSKSEKQAIEILEKLTQKKFKKVRPKWLKNPQTNYPLELDGYNEELKIAVEYQGVQHFKTKNGYFGGEKALKEIQYRDKLKRKICKQKGILLLEPDFTMSEKEILRYFYVNISKFLRGV